MSTCATVRIVDEHGAAFYVSRGHDGFPVTVKADIDRVVTAVESPCRDKGDPLGRHFSERWSGSEINLFIPLLFMLLNDVESRLPTYELLQGWRGDESYRLCLLYAVDKWAWVTLDEFSKAPFEEIPPGSESRRYANQD